MATIQEDKVTPEWVDDLYQIEMTDPVTGGSDGVANRQAKQLGQRTQWLRKAHEKTLEKFDELSNQKGTLENIGLVQLVSELSESDESNAATPKGVLEAIWAASVSVGSVEELRQYAGSSEYVHVNGYYVNTPGIGGGLFVADKSDKTSVDNGGTIIVSDNGTRWLRQIDGLKAIDFGAKLNNNHDDTSAIRQAAALGKPVDLSGGIAKVSNMPQGVFVNGVISSPSGVYRYGFGQDLGKRGLRVATWNIWSSGSSATYFGGNLFNPHRWAEIKRDLLRLDVDMAGLQETHCHAVVAPPESYKCARLKSVAASISIENTAGELYGNLNLSALAQRSHKAVTYASLPDVKDAELRTYLHTTYVFENKTISLFNTHLALSDVRRQEMITELINAVLADTSSVVFVLGDFNTSEWGLFNRLIESGYKMVNNGQYNTKVGSGSWYIDNIFYRGAQLRNAGVFENQRIGDHKALWADFVLEG